MFDPDSEASPCPEAMVAGTVALMTAWAAPNPDARLGLAAQRSLLARKVVSNLFFLQHHPDLSAGLRQVMANAHQRWLEVAQPDPQAPCVHRASAPNVLH